MTNRCFPKITLGMITFLAIFSSTSVMAESEAFKRAVKVFKQGYNECTEAQRIRSQDINQATAKFSKYLEMKDKAAKLDASILTTKLHNISREIEYCEKAQQDILRSKAFPIMESALEACKKSKEQLVKANTVNATNSYKKYEELYQKAIDVTPSIEKVSSILIKTGRCNKLKKKIVAAEVQLTKVKARYAVDHKTISSALQSCISAKKLLAGNNPLQKNIAKAKILLNESKIKLGNITNKRNKSTDYHKFASLRISQQITNKISSTKKCNTSLVSSISSAESLRKKNEATRLRAANEKLEKDKIAAEKLKAEQKNKREAERLVKEAKLTELKRTAEEKRLADLKLKEQQQLKEKEALKQKQAKDEAKKRELAKERLKNKRKSQDWSSSLGSDGASSSKDKKNDAKSQKGQKKGSDWHSLSR